MTIFFNTLTLLGGLALFLFGMNLMSQGLEKRAGGKLQVILSNMTSSTMRGFLLGTIVTVVVQSSSATTVMVVGFVNSGLMSLGRSVGVIMGANLGAASTSWILSLSGIEGVSTFAKLLQPSTFTPILAMIGIVLYMFQKDPKRKDTGLILLGFAVLMFGMETMSGSVAGLRDNPNFTRIVTLFDNPLLGVLVGIIVTAVIQSSGASIGILQALSVTGAFKYSAAIPILMGQNIGTCISALISSIGASKNGKRAAVIHLSFNVMSMLILLPAYLIVAGIREIPMLSASATPLGIAVVNTAYKVLSLIILMPLSSLFEKLAYKLVRGGEDDGTQLLDERLLNTPAVAVERCREIAGDMAKLASESVKDSFGLLDNYDEKVCDKIRSDENQVDMYEDKLGSYLVKISSHPMTEKDSIEVNKLLHLIGDFERISDHAVNLMQSAEEMRDKELIFSQEARRELSVLMDAVTEILDLSTEAFLKNDLDAAVKVEPLEQVVDHLRDELKKQHIARLQKGGCTIEQGFVLTDILTNLERVSDHCSNIAGCLLEMAHDNLDIHEYLRTIKRGGDREYQDYYDYFKVKYSL